MDKKNKVEYSISENTGCFLVFIIILIWVLFF